MIILYKFIYYQIYFPTVHVDVDLNENELR